MKTIPDGGDNSRYWRQFQIVEIIADGGSLVYDV